MSGTLHKDLTGADLHVNKEHTHVKADITDFPVLIPGTGNGDVVGPIVATTGDLVTFADDTGKVVQDGGAIPTTLPASDVSAWAKSGTKPAYASSEIANISAAGAELINDANAAAQLVTLGTAAYSEGTWAPTLNSFTIVGAAPAVTGVYRRIGNLVFLTCLIIAGAGGNTSVAATAASSYIDGFPVAPTAAVIGIVANANIVNLGICFTDSGSRLFPSAFTAQTTAIIMSITYCA